LRGIRSSIIDIAKVVAIMGQGIRGDVKFPDVPSPSAAVHDADPSMTHRNQIAFRVRVVWLEGKGPGGRFPAFGLSCSRKRDCDVAKKATGG